MAGEHSIEDEKMAGDGNMQAHVSTYGRVTAMLKWGTVVVAIIALGIIWLISRG